MLEEWLGSPAARTLGEYVTRPETSVAVLLPGFASLAILWFYERAGKISGRLKLLWLMALPVSFYFARWESNPEVQQLYIYSGFSVICMLLLFNRVYISPALAYALTFLSLWWVDVTRALCHALECGARLDQFYVGVGGAGIFDALFLIPLLTAASVAYAAARLRSRGETFRSMGPSAEISWDVLGLRLHLSAPVRPRGAAPSERKAQPTPSPLDRRGQHGRHRHLVPAVAAIG